MSLRGSMLRLYTKAVRVIVPELRHSQDLYEQTLFDVVGPGATWLDVGCGHQILPPWRLAAERELVGRAGRVVGLDMDLPAMRKHVTVRELVFADVTRLPFDDATFDLVTANMVVEHLKEPAAQFAEIQRVLKPGGLFVFHTPNLKGYIARLAHAIPEVVKGPLIYVLEGRSAQDVYPTFYRANTRQDITALAARSGFQVDKIRLILTTAQLSVVPPVAVVELLWIRMLMRRRSLREWRTNIIASLRKPPVPGGAPVGQTRPLDAVADSSSASARRVADHSTARNR